MIKLKKTNLQYQLLIFDWDGTLADSLHHIVRAIRHASNELDFPAKSDEEIKGIIGLGLEEALQRLYPTIDPKRQHAMAAQYRDYYLSTTSEGVELFPDVEDTMKLLHANGHDLAVATGKSRRGLDRALEDSGISQYFHYSRCADETFSKPHPQMLEEIIDLFAVERERVLMIGDSEHDLQMAINAGVRSAAVSYGAQSCEYLLKYNPATCFNNLGELPEWLSQSGN